MNYYIADLHIGCTNLYEHRTLEHDQILKNNWNSIITNADDVYILGDIGRTGNTKETEYLISQIATLKGKKHLIIGNHDNLKDIRLRQLFIEIIDYKEIIDNFNGMSHKLILSHYPILMWNNQHKKSILLYGHLHDTEEDYIYQNALAMLNTSFEKHTKEGRTDCPKCIAINVGVMKEYMNYTPRTLKELLKN